MSTARQRLGRLEGAVPYWREPVNLDVHRLTPAQRERCAEISERVARVGREGLSDQEVEDGAMLAEILVAPVWPVPETPPVEITTGRTR